MNYCEQCPLRLFNTKCHNLQGVGNPYNGKFILIPNVDYDAYKNKNLSFSKQVDIITQHIPFTGGLEQPYILPLLRCNEDIACEINDDIISNCSQYLKQDFITYNFKHIMLCGITVNRFLHRSINELKDKIVVSSNNRFYYSNYSPFIKYIDNNKYNEFIDNLIKFINSSIYEDYSGYQLI